MDIRDYRDLGAIIPSVLDDFGLTPSQFRVYGRIARRVGKGGYCSESAQNMAKHCHMNLKTVRGAIQFLEDHRLILVDRRPGKSPHIALTHSSDWIPVSEHPQLKTGIPKTDPTQNESGGVPKMSRGGDPKTGRGSTQNEITKGSLEGIKIKNPHKESAPLPEKPDTAKQPSVSVHTSNHSPDELPSSKEAIARLGDRWDAFINHLVEESRNWSAYQSCVSDQARVLKIKRAYLVNQFEKGNLSNLIDLFEENYSATAQKNAQQGALKEQLDYLVELHKTNPLEAAKLAKGDVRIYQKFLKEIISNDSRQRL